MAAATTIPGFHYQPTLADLQDSAKAYNGLVDSEDLKSEISSVRLQQLAEIFVKYNVHSKLGIHLIHGHTKLAPGSVMPGHTLEKPSGCWTKPVSIEGVDLTTVHGHIFKLTEGDRFVAYEYAQGSVSDLSGVNLSFFTELVDFLHSNHLEEVAGLQVLSDGAEDMVEYDFGDCGTVMLNAHDSRHGVPFRTTGWVFTLKDGVVSFSGQETHAPTVQGPHKVLINGKLVPDTSSLIGILKQLVIIG